MLQKIAHGLYYSHSIRLLQEKKKKTNSIVRNNTTVFTE